MNRHVGIVLFVALISASGLVAVFAADESPATNAQLRVLTPEQRKAWMDDLRERHPKAFEQLREELKNASPEERQKIIRAFRAKRPQLERLLERRKAMTDAERKAKREEIKGRLEKHLAALREKKAGGTLNPRESNRLERLEIISKRFQAKTAEPPESSNAKP